MGFHRSLAGVGWISLVSADSTDTYPDPIVLATVTSMTFDLKEEDVDLRGPDLDILDSFPSQRTLSGKITLSDFSSSLLSAVTNGTTVSANRKIGYTTTGAIPSTPFEVTVPLTTPTRTFATDCGVINLTDGKPMTRAATATGSNVYSVNTTTGLYTFNTADSTDQYLIYYEATPSSTDGVTSEVAQSLSSTAAPKYGIHVQKTLAGKSWGIYVPSARIPGLSTSFKRDGWSEVTLDWKATLSATSKLFYSYTPD
jgi:hypothetical protein